jgi:hypothetical protein
MPSACPPTSAGYNAAMAKPFQFSMRRMFASVTWLSVTAGLICFLATHRIHAHGIVVLLALSLPFISLGAAIGAMFGKALDGAMVGFACAFGAVLLSMLLTMFFPAVY